MAIRWVAKAWALVEEDTVCKCFRKAGILTSEMDVVSADLDEDPLSECDLQHELESLIDKTMPSDGRCTVKEYLERDNDLQVCMDKDDDEWEANFFEELGENDSEQEDDEVDEDEPIEMDVEPLGPKVKSFKEAILALEDVNHFLESHGFIQASSMVGSIVDEVAGLKAQSTTKQTTIRDFFHK